MPPASTSTRAVPACPTALRPHTRGWITRATPARGVVDLRAFAVRSRPHRVVGPIDDVCGECGPGLPVNPAAGTGRSLRVQTHDQTAQPKIVSGALTRRAAAAALAEMGVLAVTIENHDQFSRAVYRGEGVRCHG